MNKSAFNIDQQNSDLASKVVVGLERISEAFKSLLWDHAKNLGLSPIQIQILIFVSCHKPEYCSVSYLAKEFNVTKATLSDAVKVLLKKNLIRKTHAPTDARSYTISLTDPGKDVVDITSAFAAPIHEKVNGLKNLSEVYTAISQLIHELTRAGVLTVQRSCHKCSYYGEQEGNGYCNLLNQVLFSSDIRLDCPEFKEGSDH